MNNGSRQQQTISPPAFATIKTWCDLSGMGRTGTHQAIARGDLAAVKMGSRTLVDVSAGLAWMRSLPAAGPAPRSA